MVYLAYSVLCLIQREPLEPGDPFYDILDSNILQDAFTYGVVRADSE